MTRYIKDDVRYMSHEVRVAEGYMKPASPTTRKPTRRDWEYAVECYGEAGKARARGRAAVLGSAEYKAAVADFEFWTGKVAEARRRGVRI